MENGKQEEHQVNQNTANDEQQARDAYKRATAWAASAPGTLYGGTEAVTIAEPRIARR
jgi:hypothetical protein